MLVLVLMAGEGVQGGKGIPVREGKKCQGERRIPKKKRGEILGSGGGRKIPRRERSSKKNENFQERRKVPKGENVTKMGEVPRKGRDSRMGEKFIEGV